MFCLRQVYRREQRHYDKIKILPQLRSVDAGGIEMYRYQKGFIFNKDTFVVNKEYVLNARDEDFVEGTALLPEKMFEPEDLKHGANVSDMHPTDEFICSECGIVIRDLCRYEYDEDTEDESCFEFVVKYCPNCGALIKEE